MKRDLKTVWARILFLCMMVISLCGGNVQPVMAEESTTVYFQNVQGWEQVNVYVYNATGYDGNGEALGGWPGVEATDLGDGWVSVDVPAAAPFNIIFFHANNDAERAELQITDARYVYVAINKSAYMSKEEADAAVKATPTTVYFYNHNDWEEVYGYAYSNDQPVEEAWPGKAAVKAPEIGDDWWKVTVQKNALLEPFNLIFHNNNGSQTENYITNYGNNYMTGNGELFINQREAEASVGVVNETVVYFLNSKNWEEVGVYVYGVGEALGPWPGKTPEAAPEIGEKWVKMTVPAKPAFNIIFFNKASEGERAELQIPNEKTIYVTGSNDVYASKEEAEIAEGLADPSAATTVYFYNNRRWGALNCYVYVYVDGEGTTYGKGWPGTPATEATEIGENWWKYSVPREVNPDDPFYVIFTDGVNQTEGIPITDSALVYTSATEEVYASAEEVESTAALEEFDDGCDDGPNTDLDSYGITPEEAGAVLPYITYEAEAAKTNAEVLAEDRTYREAIQSEASGRQAVKLQKEGDYVEFTLTEDANAMVLRYCMPDTPDGLGLDARLSLYVDDTENRDLEVTSKYAWVYGGYPYNNDPANGLPHRFFDDIRLTFDETLPKGTKIRLQKDAGDTAEYYMIDMIECEMVAPAAAQPEGSLSITDVGAIPNDGKDDSAAICAAIKIAQGTGKEVWIPAGTFNLEEEVALDVHRVTIRGAGMWHSNLVGAGAAFRYSGTCKFYDFAMTGVSTVRDDSGDLAGFEGDGARATNVTLQNIWMEHMKVGAWTINTENLVIQGCRIRNTYADGINMCSGTTGSVVRNNNVRNTGDDCIAIWPWLANCTDNTIEHNTIMAPNLANGVAIYGGSGNVVDSNYVSEIINNGSGICVGSEFDTKEGYTGLITVSNNVLVRCGSYQTDEKYPIGALWIWSSWNPMTSGYELRNNKLVDCSYEGVLIECDSEIAGLRVMHTDVDGATDAICIRGNGAGAGIIGNIKAENYTGELVNHANTKFVVTYQDEKVPAAGNHVILIVGIGVVVVAVCGAVFSVSVGKKKKKMK